jgi:hypothetical protein
MHSLGGREKHHCHDDLKPDEARDSFGWLTFGDVSASILGQQPDIPQLTL